MLGYKRPKPGEAEHLAFRVVGFYEAVIDSPFELVKNGTFEGCASSASLRSFLKREAARKEMTCIRGR